MSALLSFRGFAPRRDFERDWSRWHWRIGVVFALLRVVVSASELPAAAGHWMGQIDFERREPAQLVWQWRKVDLHLDVSPAGNLVGSLHLAGVTMLDIPLDDVAVGGRTVRFSARLPGRTNFVVTVSTDGTAMSGQTDFQGGAAFSLQRAGDPEVKVPSGGILPAEFIGTWEGTLEVNGRKMRRATLKLTRREDGAGTGTIDWGNEETPIFCVVVVNDELHFETRLTGGAYHVKRQPDGTLDGTWKEKSYTIRLALKRV